MLLELWWLLDFGCVTIIYLGIGCRDSRGEQDQQAPRSPQVTFGNGRGWSHARVRARYIRACVRDIYARARIRDSSLRMRVLRVDVMEPWCSVNLSYRNTKRYVFMCVTVMRVPVTGMRVWICGYQK